MRQQKFFIFTVCSLVLMFGFPATSGSTEPRISNGQKLNYQTSLPFNFDRLLTWQQVTFLGVRFGPVQARLALSQQIQDPENVRNPRTEISVTELSSLRLRAEESDVKAQYQLGRLFMYGLGVSQNYQEAARWYERAAERGCADAQFMMGFLYEHGNGVRRDYRRALEYYRAAANQGHFTAANNLATLYIHGLGVPKNIGTALKWYQFSAEHGNAVGQCNLATLYFDGDGVREDYHEAARWFQAAAEQGFPAAENNLGFLYFTGQGVAQDYGEAFKWMSRAAEQGYAPAQINVGDLYAEGKGVSLDYVTAYMWYSLASAGDGRATSRIKNLSRLITHKQRIEGENRASAWLSSHWDHTLKNEEQSLAISP
jgi:TPR repeat protein